MATAEQMAREMLDRAGVDGALDMSASDLVEIANMIADMRGKDMRIAELERAAWQARQAINEVDGMRRSQVQIVAMRLIDKALDGVKPPKWRPY
jgi:hypothetical protein